MPRSGAHREMNTQNENRMTQQQAAGENGSSRQDGCVDRLVVRRNQRISSIVLKDVDWISSARNYVELHLRDEVFRSRYTLAKVAALVPARQFLRINRRTIVNLDSVAMVKPSSNGTIRIRIREGTDLSVSRRYSVHVRDVLKKFLTLQ